MELKKGKFWFKCRDCNVSIDGKHILKNLNLELKLNENIVVLGLNGSGKSTLLKLFSRFVFPNNNKLTLFKLFEEEVIEISNIRKRIGYFSSDLLNKFNTTDTVYSLLASSLKEKFYSKLMNNLIDRNKVILDEAEKRILLDLLIELNIKHLKDLKFNNLSSGQKQIIILTIALLNSPDVLLIDEPYNHLDLKYKVLFKDILQKLMIKGITVILVTHDISDISTEFQKVILMRNGFIYKFGKAEEVINSSNISELINHQVEVELIKNNWFLTKK